MEIISRIKQLHNKDENEKRKKILKACLVDKTNKDQRKKNQILDSHC